MSERNHLVFPLSALGWRWVWMQHLRGASPLPSTRLAFSVAGQEECDAVAGSFFLETCKCVLCRGFLSWLRQLNAGGNGLYAVNLGWVFWRGKEHSCHRMSKEAWACSCPLLLQNLCVILLDGVDQKGRWRWTWFWSQVQLCYKCEIICKSCW